MCISQKNLNQVIGPRVENDIQELESYTLFQEINDTFTIFSSLIKQKKQFLEIKETFKVAEDNILVKNDEHSQKDIETLVQWFRDKIEDLKSKIQKCITSSEENLAKFKTENPTLKEDIKMRIKDLKKASHFLDNLNLEEPGYYEFSELKEGPNFDSEYAGLTVKLTSYFLI